MIAARRRRALWLLLLLAGPSAHAAGKAGTTGAAFLKIAPGARAAALGEAYTAVADDAAAVVWNPAGLARVRKAEIAATHSQWLRDTDHDFLAGAIPAAGGAVGFSITSFSVGDIPKRSADTDEPDGVFDARDAAYQVGWGRPLGEAWSLGITATYVRQTLDGASAGAAAATLGAMWNSPKRTWGAGLAVRHLGGEIVFNEEGDPLPTVAALGLSYRPLGERLTIAADARLPFQGDVAESVGVEYAHPLFQEGRGFARAGYNGAATDAGGATGLSLGLGLAVGRWGVDVAWAPYGDLGDTLRYGFRVAF